MKEAPNKIYLVVGEVQEGDKFDDVLENGDYGVTWSKNQEYDTDLVYVNPDFIIENLSSYPHLQDMIREIVQL